LAWCGFKDRNHPLNVRGGLQALTKKQSFNLEENFWGDFSTAGSESDVKITKFKMADPIW